MLSVLFNNIMYSNSSIVYKNHPDSKKFERAEKWAGIAYAIQIIFGFFSEVLLTVIFL